MQYWDRTCQYENKRDIVEVEVLIIKQFSLDISTCSSMCFWFPGSNFPVPISPFPFSGSHFSIGVELVYLYLYFGLQLVYLYRSIPGFRFSRMLFLGSWFPFHSSWFPIPDSRFPISYCRYPIHDLRLPFPGSRFKLVSPITNWA